MRPPPEQRAPRPTVVAIPARDEEIGIQACLAAVFGQQGLEGEPLPLGDLQVVVLANNCRDETATAAAQADPRVRVLTLELPEAQAHAGEARRAAMEAAAALLSQPDGVICTTDADSRPRPDWLARVWSALDGGAEAVAGAVDLDVGAQPGAQAFSPGRQLEARYSALQAEITARLDPEPHNPWPNHLWAWGANLSVTLDAYRRVGGLPAEPLAEDRAFVERLRRHDVPVRHCLDARVWTSSRRSGRARGGLADLISEHLGDDRAPCDAALEPALDAARRAVWRARVRRACAGGDWNAAWSARLGVAVPDLASGFGCVWAQVELTSPLFVRRRLDLAALPCEITRAERLLRRLRPPGEADPCGSARAASAGLWSVPPPPE